MSMKKDSKILINSLKKGCNSLIQKHIKNRNRNIMMKIIKVNRKVCKCLLKIKIKICRSAVERIWWKIQVKKISEQKRIQIISNLNLNLDLNFNNPGSNLWEAQELEIFLIRICIHLLTYNFKEMFPGNSPIQWLKMISLLLSLLRNFFQGNYNQAIKT